MSGLSIQAPAVQNTFGAFPEVCPVVLAELPGFDLGGAVDEQKPDSVQNVQEAPEEKIEKFSPKPSASEPAVQPPPSEEQHFAETAPKIDIPEVQFSLPVDEDLERLPSLHVETREDRVPIPQAQTESRAASGEVGSEAVFSANVSLQNALQTPVAQDL